ncbi:hypothetical protein E2C01_052496 [Portunus trituberculatus]|uniref:Uncharacterized protein n=1 Tax=Portunus trituberculatus TaxID=210409 RepID=A0A5B7GDW4_PORTR|nr:hypothetical protein [Portunus trituberculatus]
MNLFLAVKSLSRRMSKIVIFLWDIIKEAHASIPDSTCLKFKVWAHNIHDIAISMPMWKNCSVPFILRAAYWRTHSVFADLHLGDTVRKDYP